MRYWVDMVLGEWEIIPMSEELEDLYRSEGIDLPLLFETKKEAFEYIMGKRNEL